MTGHASPQEKVRIRQLELRTDLDTGSIGDLLELAQLYIEPSHQEDRAMELCEAVLKRDPDNDEARVWLAYCCLHYLMDDSALRRAEGLLKSVITRESAQTGAAYMLLAEVLGDMGVLSPEQERELLEASVVREPGWVANRERLARVYRKQGHATQALEQLRQALENAIEPNGDWTITQRYFEESITQRTSLGVANELNRQIDDIVRTPEGEMKG